MQGILGGRNFCLGGRRSFLPHPSCGPVRRATFLMQLTFYVCGYPFFFIVATITKYCRIKLIIQLQPTGHFAFHLLGVEGKQSN